MATNCRQPEDLSGYEVVREDLDIVKYRDRGDTGYEYEDEVNERCNFDIGDLYSVAVTNTIYRGEGGSSKLNESFPISELINNIKQRLSVMPNLNKDQKRHNRNRESAN